MKKHTFTDIGINRKPVCWLLLNGGVAGLLSCYLGAYLIGKVAA